jgi:hypothetical protein
MKKLNISNADYHGSAPLSKSNLHLLTKSPAHFKYALDHKSETTAAMSFGTAFHAYVLEPEKFNEEFIVAPKIDRRTAEGKRIAAEIAESGKIPISEEDMTVIQTMAENVLSNQYAARLLSGEKEQSYFWTDERTGIQLKCRPDCRTDFANVSVIVDLKTCNNAETNAFFRDCIKYGYDLQAALYTRGVEKVEGRPHRFVFIAVEKEPPYAFNILEADRLFIEKGNADLERYLDTVVRCTETNNWYGYNGENGEPNLICLPAWLAKDYE